MKLGWQAKALDDVCGFVRGPFGGSLKKSIFVPTGYAVYEQQHAIYDQFEDVRYFIDDVKFKEMRRFQLQPNDLIMSCSGTMGRVAIVPAGIRPGIINQALLKLTPTKAISSEFLKYWMDSQDFQRALKKQSGGAAIQNVASVSVLKEIKLPLPPVSEQQRIVAILDEAFEGIATAKANAEMNLQNSHEIFQSRIQAIFSQRGEDWTEKSIQELVDEGVISKPQDGNHGEIHPTKADYVDDGVPFIMAADLEEGCVNTRDCRFISEDQARGLRVGFAKNDDVILSHKGTIGRVAILKTDEDYVILTPQVTYYRVLDKSRLFSEFLYYSLLSPAFQSAMNRIAGGGSTRAYIGITRQLELRIPIPPVELQHRLANQFRALVETTDRLSEFYVGKISALDELKQSLLHRAFNGDL